MTKKPAPPPQCWYCAKKRGHVIATPWAACEKDGHIVNDTFAHPACIQKMAERIAGTKPKHRGRK